MLFLKRASAKLTRYRPTALVAAVITMAALLAALPAGAQTAPVAVDNYYGTVADTALVVAAPGVLSNDTDVDVGDTLTATVPQVSGPSSGSLTLLSDGSFTYTPNSGFTGTDSFTYTATDGSLTSNVATVSIFVAAPEEVLVGGCVNESNNDTNNCVANDLTFVELGLGTQSDGCVNPADRLTIFMRGVIRNTTAQTRYDVGMWFPLPDPDFPDLGGYWDFQIDPEADGASSGVCAVVGLMNPEPPPVTNTCTGDAPPGNLILDLGDGPYVNGENKDAEKDNCADIYDDGHTGGCDLFPVDGSWDDSVITFVSPLTLDCNDADLDGVLDGFVSTPVCLSWGNQANQVDNSGNNLCDDQSELQPGQKSKCRCEKFQLTNIPAPDLGLTCSLPAGATQIPPGGFVQVSITYTNICDCTPDLATEERFRCCTASYVQFPVSYDATNGSYVDNIVAGNGTAIDDGIGTITWTPASPAPLGTPGVISELGSATLTFFYHLGAGAPVGATSTIGAGATWSNANSVDSNGVFTVDPEDQITLTTEDCSFTNETWATISNITAEVRDARTVVSWETSAEVGTVGFNVYRSDASGERWLKVNDALVAAIGEGPGGRYQLVDDSAPIEGTVTYKVVEVDVWGSGQEAIPVTVELSEAEGEGLHGQYVAERRRPSARMAEAIEKAARRTLRSKQTPGTRLSSVGSSKRSNQQAYVKIGVSKTGMYRVSTPEIAAALGEDERKIETRIGQHKLALTTGGQPVAWRGGPDGTGIVFFGQASESIYDAERIYMLREGQGLPIGRASGDAPQAAGEGGSFPEVVVREENLLMRPFNVIEEGQDFWFWSGAITGHPDHAEKRFEFELEGVAGVNASARVTVTFVGFGVSFNSGGSVIVNGHHVGDFIGPVFSREQAMFEFDQSFLNSGGNTIDLIGQEGGFLIDRFDIGYHRLLHTSTDELIVRTDDDTVVSITGFTTAAIEVYDVSDPLRPVILPAGATSSADGSSTVVSFSPTTTMGSYLALSADAVRLPSSIDGRTKSELLGSVLGAEYLIITTAELESTAERLAEYRQDKGLEAMIVDVEDIFDDFAFGARDPGAITAFLTYAMDRWTTPPKYVLLAGRGHYDYKDLMGYGGNHIPPVLAATSRGLIPSDNKLADLNGNGLPDVAIGRLPVLNAEELSSVIDKIITYEGEPTGPWATRVVLVADNPDDAGNFYASSDALAQSLTGGRTAEEFYLSQPYTADQIHDYLMGSLEEGVGVLNWIGHAGFDSLAHERVLEISHLADLGPTQHPSMVLGLTCLINNHGFPYFASFGEELVLVPHGGAIGVWSASGLSKNLQAERLGTSFMAALDSSDQLRLGDIIQLALEDFTRPGADVQTVYKYVLFADPALVLK